MKKDTVEKTQITTRIPTEKKTDLEEKVIYFKKKGQKTNITQLIQVGIDYVLSLKELKN